MRGGDLGDQRLNVRRDRLIAAFEQSPDAPFPAACAGDAEVEALYRFLRNRRVSWREVVEPHLRATEARCAAVGEVLVLHDTTDMVFRGAAPRAGLRTLSTQRQGYWLHVALAVSAEGLRAPLGLLALQPFVRPVRAPGPPSPPSTPQADSPKESRCWGEGVAAVRARLATRAAAIHVMDRAGDSYELFADLLAHHDRFVVRLAQDRQVTTEDGAGRLHTVVPREALGERQVTLAPRSAGSRPQYARHKHPPREGRVATLRFAAREVTLQRPAHLPSRVPPHLRVHVVYVWEVDAPAGEVPVEWRLISREPIATVTDVLRIIDVYRTRWLIEEFFKALKTGCAYEQRQLESLHTLLVALALLAPVAWQLLLLRHLAQTAPESPATAVLTARQLALLRAHASRPQLGPQPTVAEALLAVASLGGHLRQNGPPGWLVLGRGLHKLGLMESGWIAAQRAPGCDQS
jgi:transposase-like protein/DDE family transposase